MIRSTPLLLTGASGWIDPPHPEPTSLPRDASPGPDRLRSGGTLIDSAVRIDAALVAGWVDAPKP